MISTFREIPILDGHIHFGHPAFMPGLVDIMDANRIDKFNIVCTPHTARLSLVPDALLLKDHYPNRVYVFGGLDISPLFLAPDTCGTHFADYVNTLMGMGCDGVKMIEGKPDTRKMLPIPPFDSPPYLPYWAKLEESGVPVLFHVNDPEEFWDAARIPEWAKERGWFYGDGTYINNEVQYQEVLNVLHRHPGVKVIFAHFFFLSNQLDRLADYLDEFPNMHVDLTPGIEMYFNFAKKPKATREFFIKYQDQIVYGTDIGAKALLASPEAGIEPAESAIRVNLVRSFLEIDGPFQLNLEQGYLFGRFEGTFQGIGLPEEVLHKIYHQNFEKLAGNKPRLLDPQAIIKECDRLMGIISAMGAAQPGVPGDTSIARMVKSYFERGKKL